ncbi:TIGR03089 family protein [Corynebacterium sp.]|uniref:TIGR03089 family protein n=1 Tax=Corynebacterium sp. TaxID=1720 RepID=UPI0026DA7E7D|nr:TIGR03089 family protein [Corynebacterium sp.]MDO4610558.1 TIGR03089 family protein [Corynebacterium sp.]
MDLLKHLLDTDPSTPRLTCYDETTGGRTDLNAATLDNWASKVANMLHDEFDLEPGDRAWVDLPLTWPAACIVLGAARAGVELSDDDPLAVFTSLDRLSEWEEKAPDAVLSAVTDDAFGRGVVECGLDLPPGVVDFGPAVRMYGDAYAGPGPDPDQPLFGGRSVRQLGDGARALARERCNDRARLLTRGWLDDAGRLDADAWVSGVLMAWASGGSVVVVRGGDADRVAAVAEMENAARV